VSVHLNSAPRQGRSRDRGLGHFSPRRGGNGQEAAFEARRGGARARVGRTGEQRHHEMLGRREPAGDDAEERSPSEEILALPPARPPAAEERQTGVCSPSSSRSTSPVSLEGGFLTNSKDAAFVKEAKGRQALAEAVAAGIVSYMKKYPPPAAANRAGRATVVHRVKAGETLWAICATVQHDRRVDQKLQPARRVGCPRCRPGTRDPGYPWHH